jgi:hypothetical protein
MKFNKFTRVVQCVVVLAFVAGCASLRAAAPTKQIPDAIITLQGKSYPSARLVRAEPDGITVQYTPQAGGVGLAKLKFRNLPEKIRQDFKYDEAAASEFERSRANALAEWRNSLSTRPAVEEDSQSPEIVQNEASATRVGEQPFPVGRFRAEGTIRGAMIIDTITGEAWMADLHSTLGYYDYTPFLQPKVPLPAQSQPGIVIIGP